MKKLLSGIVDFRQTRRKEYKEMFKKLSIGQNPDCLYLTCCDSRVVANVFASTNPGDLFVVRNVGNLVPPATRQGFSSGDVSQSAALEFALQSLNVSSVIICGHSECGAMMALHQGREKVTAEHFRQWLEHGDEALNRLNEHRLSFIPEPNTADYNVLSQENVLLQIEHLKTFPFIAERISSGKLTVHAWWFEIANVNVYAFDDRERRFRIIEGTWAQELLDRVPPSS